MRAQQATVWQIKCVLLVARGMVGGGVEGIKAVPFGLDVRAFGECEPHPPENRDAAIEHLREWMKRTALMRCARKRDIDVGNRSGFFFGAKIFRAHFNRSRYR